MEWTRSETLALALADCTHCRGLGLFIGKRGKPYPCKCVLRSIFRSCFRRFRECVEKEKHLSRTTLGYSPGTGQRRTWSRKNEEYVVDFLKIAGRTLPPRLYTIFRIHYLMGADWRLCCRQFKMDRDFFFYTAYGIEQRLGRVFRELEPYALYPLDEYFHNVSIVERRATPIDPDEEDTRRPLRPPMAA